MTVMVVYAWAKAMVFGAENVCFSTSCFCFHVKLFALPIRSGSSQLVLLAALPSRFLFLQKYLKLNRQCRITFTDFLYIYNISLIKSNRNDMSFESQLQISMEDNSIFGTMKSSSKSAKFREIK